MTTNTPRTTSARIELLRRPIPGDANLEAVPFLLSLKPGGAAPVHNYPGIGVGYVLEGVYESQYEGGELKRFVAGDAIYDLAETPHLIARNGSETEWLRFRMTFVVLEGQATVNFCRKTPFGEAPKGWHPDWDSFVLGTTVRGAFSRRFQPAEPADTTVSEDSCGTQI